MINFPESTIYNKFIPKEKFYARTSISTKLKDKFTSEIERITWTHKLSPETLNIAKKAWPEIEVFEIKLKSSGLSREILKHIDTFIPYPILFILNRGASQKAVIAFKEPNFNNTNRAKVDTYFETPWQEKLNLEIKGSSTDKIYDNFLRQINPGLEAPDLVDVKTAVELDKVREKIKAQIETLNRQIVNEAQPNKRQSLARERAELEKQLL